MDAYALDAVTRDMATGDDFESRAAALFNAEAPSLLHLARFYVEDKTAAEDLVQEAFISSAAAWAGSPTKPAQRHTSARSSSTSPATTTGAASCRCGTARRPRPGRAVGRGRRLRAEPRRDVIDALRALPGASATA